MQNPGKDLRQLLASAIPNTRLPDFNRPDPGLNFPLG
jgi:hypothetical protein